MKISVFHKIEYKTRDGCYRTSDGYMYTIDIYESIFVYVNNIRIYQTAWDIIDSFIKEKSSVSYEKEPYRYDKVEIKYSSFLTKKLVSMLQDNIQEIQEIEGVEILLPSNSFYPFSSKLDIVNDQNSRYNNIEEGYTSQMDSLRKEYEAKCERLKKDYHIRILEATLDRNLNQKNSRIGNLYPLDFALQIENESLLYNLLSRNSSKTQYPYQMLKWLREINFDDETISLIFEKSLNDFDEIKLNLLMREAIIMKNSNLIYLLSKKVDLNKYFVYYKDYSFKKENKSWFNLSEKIEEYNNHNSYCKHEDWFTGKLYTPLSLACITGEVKSIDILLDAGGDITKKDPIRNFSYFDLAIKTNEMIALHLIERKINVEIRENLIFEIIECKHKNLINKILTEEVLKDLPEYILSTIFMRLSALDLKEMSKTVKSYLKTTSI